MPQIADNGIVKLDILPDGKPKEMAEQAGDKAQEGAGGVGWVFLFYRPAALHTGLQATCTLCALLAFTAVSFCFCA